MPAPVFAPPHPRSVLQIMRQVYRDYLASGNAAGIDVTTIANHAANVTTSVSGTVYVDTVAPMPATVTVILTQSSATKGTQSASVSPTTGGYATSFPANTLAVGTATATVSSTMPAESTTSNIFTLT
jgi:hypothetical protein